jgi:hypothetical protein
MDKNDNFSVNVDVARDYVEVKLSGFLDLATVAAFDEAYRAAKDKLSSDRSRHVTLIDVSELKLQSQSVVSDFALMMGDSSIQSARLAFVVGDSAVKMQLRRLAHERTALFESIDEARNWLLS